MRIKLKKINYNKLNAKQKENYNFQKVSAVLAEYGFTTIKLSDDWNGTDFIAVNPGQDIFLKVQLKARLSFYKKYLRKNIYICFPEKGNWYLYSHDNLLNQYWKSVCNFSKTVSWSINGGFSFPAIPEKANAIVDKYKI